MALTLVTGPESEPVSLDEARAHLRVDLDDEDLLIVSWIKAARRACEMYTGKALVSQTWRLTADYGWPTGNRIVLPRPPLDSVTSITYVDLNGASQTLAADQYTVFKQDTGESAIVPAYDVIWPEVRCVPAAVTVTFVAGTDVANVPEELRQAILLLVENQSENRGPVNVGNIVNEMPLNVRWLMDFHRVHPFR